MLLYDVNVVKYYNGIAGMPDINSYLINVKMLVKYVDMSTRYIRTGRFMVKD